MTYGHEVPFSDGYCSQNTVCTVGSSKAITVTNTHLVKRDASVDPTKLGAVFNLSASYGYSKSVAYTGGTELNMTLSQNQCGYWTFIPYMME
jgi:hypothetical protein